MELTREDWVEVYAALETKREALQRGDYAPEDKQGQDNEWIAHLNAIMEKIGPDGEAAFNRQEKT